MKIIVFLLIVMICRSNCTLLKWLILASKGSAASSSSSSSSSTSSRSSSDEINMSVTSFGDDNKNSNMVNDHTGYYAKEINYIPKHNIPDYSVPVPQAFTIILQQNAGYNPEFFASSPIYKTIPTYHQPYVHDIGHNRNLETYKIIDHRQYPLPAPVETSLPYQANLYKPLASFNAFLPRITKVLVQNKGADVAVTTNNYNSQIRMNYGEKGEAFITPNKGEYDDYFKSGHVVQNGIVTVKEGEKPSICKNLDYQPIEHQETASYGNRNYRSTRERF
ncbi:uncharacterized protein LOC119645288 isoform X1 [Glossina fuscipes]|uniref:Uncharacterized protein LOC119645288 isoform X1 n=2 Tax=Glossina fuscipes TaxID=7396 RepID=A0A9C5ZQD7_9MUSC|nr:uncharacterized protein LOC119645288 isoform X1 [Glossina fuscipes]